MTIEPPLYSKIVAFWREAGAKRWFAHDPGFDADIRTRFEPMHHAAARGDYADWSETAEGALALVVLLDQFPRNLYRGSAHSFATDPLARRIARQAVAEGRDRAVDRTLRVFFYLPFEHSEDISDQDLCVTLIAALGDKEWSRYADLHRDIIGRFGRFPHRNAALGRESTAEEIAFLKDGGFAG